IRTRVERGDLLRLLLAGREHDDRDRRPGAEPPDHIDAVDPRQPQIEDHDVGTGADREVERGLAVRRRNDLVASRDQVRPQSPQHLRLLADDQNPRHDATATPITIVDPPPGVSSTAISPSIASTKPFATASPSPTPLRLPRSPNRWNGRKIRS